jgi:hypothetical protein
MNDKVDGKNKRMDIPVWMLDRAICAAMVRLDGTPHGPFRVLCGLRDLIVSSLSARKELEQTALQGRVGYLCSLIGARYNCGLSLDAICRKLTSRVQMA